MPNSPRSQKHDALIRKLNQATQQWATMFLPEYLMEQRHRKALATSADDPKKKQTLAARIRTERFLPCQIELATYGRKLTALEAGAASLLGTEYLKGWPNVPKEQWLENWVGIEIFQLGLQLVDVLVRKDYAGLHTMACWLKEFRADSKDPVRELMLVTEGMRLANRKHRKRPFSVRESARRSDYRGNIDFYRRELRELNIPYENRQGKGGGPRKLQTHNRKNRRSKS